MNVDFDIPKYIGESINGLSKSYTSSQNKQRNKLYFSDDAEKVKSLKERKNEIHEIRNFLEMENNLLIEELSFNTEMQLKQLKEETEQQQEKEKDKKEVTYFKKKLIEPIEYYGAIAEIVEQDYNQTTPSTQTEKKKGQKRQTMNLQNKEEDKPTRKNTIHVQAKIKNKQDQGVELLQYKTKNSYNSLKCSIPSEEDVQNLEKKIQEEISHHYMKKHSLISDSKAGNDNCTCNLYAQFCDLLNKLKCNNKNFDAAETKTLENSIQDKEPSLLSKRITVTTSEEEWEINSDEISKEQKDLGGSINDTERSETKTGHENTLIPVGPVATEIDITCNNNDNTKEDNSENEIVDINKNINESSIKSKKVKKVTEEEVGRSRKDTHLDLNETHECKSNASKDTDKLFSPTHNKSIEKKKRLSSAKLSKEKCDSTEKTERSKGSLELQGEKENKSTKKENKLKKKNQEKKKRKKKKNKSFSNTTSHVNCLYIERRTLSEDMEDKSTEYKIDKDTVFIQIEHFAQKIDEYISDEKIFRAQKLIEHVKKYTEYYINHFKIRNKKTVVDQLVKYYNENCKNRNIKYNINNLKTNLILHLLNFFCLNEMSTTLNEYCYYFTVEPSTNNEGMLSDSTNEYMKNPCLNNIYEDGMFKFSLQSCTNSELDMKTPSINYFNVSENVRNSILKMCETQNNLSYFDMNENDTNENETNEVTDSNEKKNSKNAVIIDKFYHSHIVTSNVFSNTNFISEEDRQYNTNKGIRRKGRTKKGKRTHPHSKLHMMRFLKKYSRRIGNFKKHKQSKEGWIKEDDKYLDLWYRTDSQNNISVHVKAKLSYEVIRILSILNETDVSVNWAPFLISAEKLKDLSKASAIINQLYEYPVIGKKESLMYCLGANVLEELGCIILCCKAPPDFNQDIIFYKNMCDNLKINEYNEIMKIKEIETKAKKSQKEIIFFDFQLPDPLPKTDRQRAADLCFLLHPLKNGKSTVLELFLHFENDFKYTPIKMVTYFIKKIVKNMYGNIIKCCKNYEKNYSGFLHKNKEFYDWLDLQIKNFLQSKQNVKLIDTVSLKSYNDQDIPE